MRLNFKRGEIATILTVAALIVVGAATLVSTALLPKKQTTSSKASGVSPWCCVADGICADIGAQNAFIGAYKDVTTASEKWRSEHGAAIGKSCGGGAPESSKGTGNSGNDNAKCFSMTDEIYYNGSAGFAHWIKLASPPGGGDGHTALYRNGTGILFDMAWDKSADNANPLVIPPERNGGNMPAGTYTFAATVDHCSNGIGNGSVTCTVGTDAAGKPFANGAGCIAKNFTSSGGGGSGGGGTTGGQTSTFPPFSKYCNYSENTGSGDKCYRGVCTSGNCAFNQDCEYNQYLAGKKYSDGIAVGDQLNCQTFAKIGASPVPPTAAPGGTGDITCNYTVSGRVNVCKRLWGDLDIDFLGIKFNLKGNPNVCQAEEINFTKPICVAANLCTPEDCEVKKAQAINSILSQGWNQLLKVEEDPTKPLACTVQKTSSCSTASTAGLPSGVVTGSFQAYKDPPECDAKCAVQHPGWQCISGTAICAQYTSGGLPPPPAATATPVPAAGGGAQVNTGCLLDSSSNIPAAFKCSGNSSKVYYTGNVDNLTYDNNQCKPPRIPSLTAYCSAGVSPITCSKQACANGATYYLGSDSFLYENINSDSTCDLKTNIKLIDQFCKLASSATSAPVAPPPGETRCFDKYINSSVQCPYSYEANQKVYGPGGTLTNGGPNIQWTRNCATNNTTGMVGECNFYCYSLPGLTSKVNCYPNQLPDTAWSDFLMLGDTSYRIAVKNNTPERIEIKKIFIQKKPSFGNALPPLEVDVPAQNQQLIPGHMVSIEPPDKCNELNFGHIRQYWISYTRGKDTNSTFNFSLQASCQKPIIIEVN